MAHKIDQRVEKTKRLLKKSLLELLENRDIKSISIKELCEHAGINRTTFYKHYHTQYDLFEEMESDLLTSIENKFAYHSANAPESEQFTQVLSYMKDNKEFCKILMRSDNDFSFETRLMSLPTVIKRVNVPIDSTTHEYTSSQLFVMDGAYYAIKRWLLKGCVESPEDMAIMIRSISKKMWNS